jgi:hypothetical protein
MPGLFVLKNDGFKTSAKPILAVTGLGSFVMAFLVHMRLIWLPLPQQSVQVKNHMKTHQNAGSQELQQGYFIFWSGFLA